MSKRDTSSGGKVREETTEFQHDLDDDIIELDDTFFERAQFSRGGKVIRQATGTLTNRGRPPLPEGTRKVSVSLRLSPDILWWLRCTGPGWQSRVEQMLREKMQAALASKD